MTDDLDRRVYFTLVQPMADDRRLLAERVRDICAETGATKDDLIRELAECARTERTDQAIRLCDAGQHGRAGHHARD